MNVKRRVKIVCLLVTLTFLLINATFALAQPPEHVRERLYNLADAFRQQQTQEKEAAVGIARALGMIIRQEFADGRIIELMRFEDGHPIYYTTHNLEGAGVIYSDRVWPGGAAGLNLTGQGQTLGMWDGGGTRLTHQEFGGRAVQRDVGTTLSNHATHVAGTMIAGGVSAPAKGMSYQASLDAYDWHYDLAEMADAAADGLQVSNHSYGTVTGWAKGNWCDTDDTDVWHWFGDPTVSTTEDYRFGFYDDSARDWDTIAVNAPRYLIVKSAGNDRNENFTGQHYYFQDDNCSLSTAHREPDGGSDGYDSIPTNGNAKNILTVGAVTAAGVMSSFSGWGPTDDGRVKPDVVAKGVSVTSALATDDTAYASWNGTSMSGPMVSGSVGLLLQHQENLHGPGAKLRAATLKALIIHGADDAISGAPGPDYRFGWGLMNTQRAIQIMTLNAQNTAVPNIHEFTLKNSEEIDIQVQASGSEPLRAVIVWTDPPGTPFSSANPAEYLNPPDLMLVNDLDMRIIAPDTTSHAPYILDPANPSQVATTGDNFRDNVEMIHIDAPQTGGLYAIKVSHKAALAGGSQDVSLIITGISSFAVPGEKPVSLPGVLLLLLDDD